MKTPEGAGAGEGPILLTRMYMQADFLAAGVDRNKVNRQPTALLLEPWRHRDQSSSLPTLEAPTAREKGRSMTTWHPRVFLQRMLFSTLNRAQTKVPT